MPDPRIRRTRPHGARRGMPPRGGEPASPETPGGDEPVAATQPGGPENGGIDLTTPELESVPAVQEAEEAEPIEAEPAQVEPEIAGAEATDEGDAGSLAATVAAAAVVAESGDEPGRDADREPEPGPEAEADLQPEPEAGPESEAEPAAEPEAEAAGWFREEPLDEGADDEASWAEAEAEAEAEARGAELAEQAPDDHVPPEEMLPGGEDETVAGDLAGATVVAAAVGEPDVVVRDRDRPVVTAAPLGSPPRRHGRLRGLVIGIVTIAAVAAVGFVAGLMLPTLLPGPGIASGSPEPTAAASETPATPAPTVEPTATPTTEPTPEPTPTPTPAPTPITYVVKANDSLLDIAERFGVTVAAIRRANNIDDPNLIQIGQRLTIPPPRATPEP